MVSNFSDNSFKSTIENQRFNHIHQGFILLLLAPSRKKTRSSASQSTNFGSHSDHKLWMSRKKLFFFLIFDI